MRRTKTLAQDSPGENSRNVKWAQEIEEARGGGGVRSTGTVQARCEQNDTRSEGRAPVGKLNTYMHRSSRYSRKNRGTKAALSGDRDAERVCERREPQAARLWASVSGRL